MPRPRKNDPTALIKPIVEQFAYKLASVVERFTIERVEEAVRRQAAELRARRGRGDGARRQTILCYYPGCKNVAAPRFGMFCAAEHKGISKAEKERIRAQRGEKPKAKRARKR